MNYTNKYGLPKWVVNYAENAEKRRRIPNRYSANDLAGAPLIRHLLMTRWDDITIDVSEYVNMILGSNLHAIAEDYCPEDETAEEKIETKVGPITIVRVHDQWIPANTEIGDFKTSKIISAEMGMKQDYINVANIYAWQRRQMGQMVNNLTLSYFFKDHMPMKAAHSKSSDYPRVAFMKIAIPCWTPEEASLHVAGRLEAHAKPVTECTDTEKWQSSPQWAVNKPWLKKPCKKLCDTLEQAQSWANANIKSNEISKISIDPREGQPIKCKYYCGVRSVCPYAPEDIFLP